MTDHDKMDEMILEHPFFKGLSEEHLKTVRGCISNVKFNEGEIIHRTNDNCDRFYLIRYGNVAIELFTPGRGTIHVQTVGEGEMLGWSWIVAPYKWKFDSRAVTLVRAFAVEGKCLREKAERDPALGYELLKRASRALSNRLEATRIQLLDLYGVHV